MLKNRGFYRGINFGGWLSQCDYSEEHLNSFITEPDFAQVAAWGLDHVRIPVDYNILEQENGTPKEDGYSYLDNALTFCRKYGLHMVLDLHKTAGFSFDEGETESGFFDSPALQERFFHLWEEIAQRYGSYPQEIAFELLNEVTDKAFMDNWNRIAGECIRHIRAYAPETLILVGGYDNNSAWAVESLDAPYDANIIYNFHCYEPLKFTHQGATWTEKIDPDETVAFAESGTTQAYFEELFADAIAAAKANGTVLYCGEYGVIDRVSAEDALAWYRMIHEVFEKYGIARSAWCYKEKDFGIISALFDDVRAELVKNL